VLIQTRLQRPIAHAAAGTTAAEAPCESPDRESLAWPQGVKDPTPGISLFAAAARFRIAAGAPTAGSGLAYLLQELGRAADSEQVWRDAVAAGDADVRRGLALMLQERGRAAEAEQAWRDAVAAGDPGVRPGLAHLLREQAGPAPCCWCGESANGSGNA
jgi:hypothetical protein